MWRVAIEAGIEAAEAFLLGSPRSSRLGCLVPVVFWSDNSLHTQYEVVSCNLLEMKTPELFRSLQQTKTGTDDGDLIQASRGRPGSTVLCKCSNKFKYHMQPSSQ
jgi:hypothetical protein